MQIQFQNPIIFIEFECWDIPSILYATKKLKLKKSTLNTKTFQIIKKISLSLFIYIWYKDKTKIMDFIFIFIFDPKSKSKNDHSLYIFWLVQKKLKCI